MMFTSTYKVDLALVLMSVMPVHCWIAHYNGNISKERVIKVTDWTNALIKNKSQHRKCYCSFFFYRFSFSSRAVSRAQGSQALDPICGSKDGVYSGHDSPC